MVNQRKILRVLQLIAQLRLNPPKSIRFLSGLLGSTDRTVYRYFDLLRELGFDLQSDGHNRFLIPGSSDETEYRLTSDEAALLRTLVLTDGRRNKLRDGILRKLYMQSDQTLQADLLVNARLSTLVRLLSQAMAKGRQVILVRYHSANSGVVSDRLVEPVRFTENYHSVCAFEVKTAKNKYFNLERITHVKIMQSPFRNRTKHQWEPTDAFGFTAQSGEEYLVSLRLGVKAYVLLREEYPMTLSHLKAETRRGNSNWRLEIPVNNPRPVVRFILGNLDDVEVVGSSEFLRYFKSYVNELVKKRLISGS